VITTSSDTTVNEVLMADGVAIWQKGHVVAPGLAIHTFAWVDLNDGGDAVANVTLTDGTPFPDESGIVFNATLLARTGDVAATSGLPPGTVYVNLHDVHLNEARQLLVRALVDTDPAGPFGTLAVLLLWDVDDTGILAESVVVKAGDVLPGQAGGVTSFSISARSRALDAAGRALYSIRAAPDGNTAVYLDDTLVVEQGDPIGGTTHVWGDLLNLSLDLNDVGDWVLVDNSADFSAEVLALDGSAAFATGDGHPAPDGFTLTGIAAGLGLRVGDNRNVLWVGDWNDPDSSKKRGLFLGDRLLVQEGVSAAGGVPVDMLWILDGIDLSDDGRRVLLVATLDGGKQGLYRVDVGQWDDLGNGLAGTAGVTPALTATDTLCAGATVIPALRGALPSSQAHFVLGLSTLFAPLKGGVLVPFPDVLVFGLPVDTAGELVIELPLPDPLPPGIPLVMQFWVSDAGGPAGFSASNAVGAVTD
jgi:hypothetical protein